MTSTTTVSTLGALGFSARTFFVAAGRLDLALARVRFAVFPLALDILRDLPRTDDLPLRTELRCFPLAMFASRPAV
jgi:hypothetical protein